MADDDKDADVKEVLKALQGMTAQLGNLGPTVAGAVRSAIREEIEDGNRRRAALDDDPDPDPDPEPDADELEKMDRSQFADSILARVEKVVEKSMGSIDKKLTESRNQSRAKDLKAEWEGLLTSTKDDAVSLDALKQETFDTLKSKPDLSVNEAFALAKANNPDKVKELTTAAETKAKEEQDKKAADEKPKFGGLLPTGDLSGKEKEEMTRDEAVDAAWEDMMSEMDPSAANHLN